ncbi:hypothetical protein PIB30_072988 [Stylosanthes scabra]|uniref:Uncharacterized protein n=1 Tax=Stylosanthes scabra TaxID=79078 RepID=A0ABU6WS28_9FABA|nr:hypothetical protein [Stylosanthes scabra]
MLKVISGLDKVEITIRSSFIQALYHGETSRLFVNEEDDGLRLCVDYRQLGKAAIRDNGDAFIFSRIRECLEYLEVMLQIQKGKWYAESLTASLDQERSEVSRTKKKVLLGNKATYDYRWSFLRVAWAQLQVSSNFKTSILQAQTDDQEFPETVEERPIRCHSQGVENRGSQLVVKILELQWFLEIEKCMRKAKKGIGSKGFMKRSQKQRKLLVKLRTQHWNREQFLTLSRQSCVHNFQTCIRNFLPEAFFEFSGQELRMQLYAVAAY